MTNLPSTNSSLPDPDQGKPVKDSIRQQLLAMRDRRLEQKQAIPSAQVMDELGLNECRSHWPPPRNL